MWETRSKQPFQQPVFHQLGLNLIADHYFSYEVALLDNPGESWYTAILLEIMKSKLLKDLFLHST